MRRIPFITLLGVIFLLSPTLMAGKEEKSKSLYYQALFEEDNTKQADLYKSLLTEYPKTEYGKAAKIWESHSKNDRESMLKLSTEFSEKYPASPIGFYYQAWFKLFVDIDYKEAVRLSSQGIAFDSNYPKNYMIRALASAPLPLADHLNAIKDWDKYLSYYPNYSTGYFRRGVSKQVIEDASACRDYKTANQKKYEFSSPELTVVEKHCGELKFYSEQWHWVAEKKCVTMEMTETTPMFKRLINKTGCSVKVTDKDTESEGFLTFVCPNGSIFILTETKNLCENLHEKLYPQN